MDVTSAITSKISSNIQRRACEVRHPMRVDPRLRARILVLAAISAADIATLVGLDVHAPAIVYNASGSAPLGFYYLDHRMPGRGEVAVVRPPLRLAASMNARGILPAGVPLVKQVTAL